MTIDVSTVRSFLAVVVGIQITMMLFAPLRFFLLRKGWQQRSTLALWSDVFFTFGWLLIMGWGWYMISLCIRDLTIRKVENSDLGVAKHFNPRSLIKIWMANFILSMASIYSFKMAFVCMYADLYSRTVNIRKCALYLVAAFVPLAFVTVVSVALLNCRPLSFAWGIENFRKTSQVCSPSFSRRVQSITLILTVLTDLLLIALPLYILASLTLSVPEKRGVAFICLLALMSIAAAVTRFVTLDLQGAYDLDGERHKVESDKFYWTLMLTWLEIAAVEIAFVLPALRMVLVGRGRKRGSEGKEVMMIALVEENQDEVLVDREDPEAMVWGFGRDSSGR